MRIGVLLVAYFVLAGAAHAGPIMLSCTGSFFHLGKSMELDRQTAMLDLENRSFEPPLYGALALTQIGEAAVSFAKETSDVSIQGRLDRVSGALSLNTMIPSERKKLEAGEGYTILNWMSAKCVPAQRMF